jgi:hypothetical protein
MEVAFPFLFATLQTGSVRFGFFRVVNFLLQADNARYILDFSRFDLTD